MRLDKLLAHMGFGTRKDCKKLLKSGQVLVNGQVEVDGGKHVNPERDIILCAGEQVIYKEFIYLMMNKPPGVISATEDMYEQTVIDLLTKKEQHFRPFPVGRLDKDTEGLLLLTNDGKLAHELLSPRKQIPKIYYAELDRPVSEEDILAFAQGVTLDDGYRTLPAKLVVKKLEPVPTIELTIVEGKFHQVKRMFLARGKRVIYLKRIAMGGLWLDPDLAKGDYRELTDREVERLKRASSTTHER